jgi:hypothetical protein
MTLRLVSTSLTQACSRSRGGDWFWTSRVLDFKSCVSKLCGADGLASTRGDPFLSDTLASLAQHCHIGVFRHILFFTHVCTWQKHVAQHCSLTIERFLRWSSRMGGAHMFLNGFQLMVFYQTPTITTAHRKPPKESGAKWTVIFAPAVVAQSCPRSKAMSSRN